MGYKAFVDAQRRRWDVWDVHPAAIERRTGLDRRRAPRADRPERRVQVERRRMRLAPELRQGWLCFECAGERRRLAPIPSGWELLPEPELAVLCLRATPAPRQMILG